MNRYIAFVMAIVGPFASKMIPLAAFIAAGAPLSAVAQDYRYNPANKVDPFQSITLRKTTVRGLSRLQDYEVAALELVGTVTGEEITALILTPDPREGILAKIGDRVGKKGGRIIAISRNKVVVRESAQGVFVPGGASQFNDVILALTSREQGATKRSGTSDAEKALGFPSLDGGRPPSGLTVQPPANSFPPGAPPGFPPGFPPPAPNKF